jgi:hypothetical protein
MYQYAILIYDNESDVADEASEQIEAVLGRHAEFVEANAARVLSGYRLRPGYAATSVRRSGEQDLVTDGVFVETKEVLGGFYLVEAADLDEAIMIAKQVPAPWGGVEIRPLWVDPS